MLDLKDISIDAMRLCYVCHLSKIPNKAKVLKELEDIVELMNNKNPFYSPTGSAVSYSQEQRQIKIKDFVRKTFANTVFEEFDKDIDVRNTKFDDVNLPSNPFGALLLVVGSSIQSVKEASKFNASRRLKYLELLSLCLKYKGLHPYIDRRPKNCKRYSLLLEYKKDNKNKIATRLLFSNEELFREYLKPYFEQTVLVLNGTKIEPDSIEKINIYSTLLNNDEVALFSALNHISYSDKMNLSEQTRLIKLFKDETNDLLKSSRLTSIVNEFQYVDLQRIEMLRTIKSQKFDFAKLIHLLEELNLASSNNMNYAVLFLLRAIKDHIPPIFGARNYNDFVNTFKGRSIKKLLLKFEDALKHLADIHIHSHINKSQVIPNSTQVDFRQSLDALLGEIYKKMNA